jgi:hypothetical protein
MLLREPTPNSSLDTRYLAQVPVDFFRRMDKKQIPARARKPGFDRYPDKDLLALRPGQSVLL